MVEVELSAAETRKPPPLSACGASELAAAEILSPITMPDPCALAAPVPGPMPVCGSATASPGAAPFDPDPDQQSKRRCLTRVLTDSGEPDDEESEPETMAKQITEAFKAGYFHSPDKLNPPQR